MITWNVNHRAKELKHQVCVFTTLLNHNCKALEMLDKVVKGIWIELRNITNTFEEQSVAKFASSCNEFVELAITSEHVCVTLICCKVNCKSNKLLPNNWLRAMDYQLINEWDAISISKCCLCFILETQMVQQFYNLCSKTWCFKSINKFGYHSLIVHLYSYLLIK